MYLVFDIGGTFVKFAKITLNGEILYKSKIPTNNKEGIDVFLDTLVAVYQEHKEGVEGIAVSTPGAVDVEKGIIYNGGNLPFLHQSHFRDMLSSRCDNLPVAVENDGKCAGLAEAWIGAAKDVQDAIVLAFGTGIAGAVIKNKKIHRGNRLIAGEVSFLINEMDRHRKPVIWAHQNSALGLGAAAEKVKGLEPGSINGEKFFEMANANDPDCLEILADFCYRIAVQTYNMTLIFDPDIICIGGGISEQPLLIEEIRRQIDVIWEQVPHIGKPNITKCAFNNDSNLLGALYNFMQVYHLD